MERTAFENQRQAIRQLVLRLLTPHARALQPVELVWAPNPSSETQELVIYVQNTTEPHVMIPVSHDHLESAVRPHEVAAYRDLEAYLGQHLQPLMGEAPSGPASPPLASNAPEE